MQKNYSWKNSIWGTLNVSQKAGDAYNINGTDVKLRNERDRGLFSNFFENQENRDEFHSLVFKILKQAKKKSITYAGQRDNHTTSSR